MQWCIVVQWYLWHWTSDLSVQGLNTAFFLSVLPVNFAQLRDKCMESKLCSSEDGLTAIGSFQNSIESKGPESFDLNQ